MLILNRTIIGSQFPEVAIPIIDHCKKSIDIIVYDWRWYANDIGSSVQLFNQAIARASARGVAVRVITSCPVIITKLKNIGCEAKKLESKKLIHCKAMILDNKYLIIGSHNYTQSAFNINHELSVLLENPDFLGDISAYFNNLWRL